MVWCYEIGESRVQETNMKAKFDHQAAVLAYAFSVDVPWVYSGGLDTVVRK